MFDEVKSIEPNPKNPTGMVRGEFELFCEFSTDPVPSLFYKIVLTWYRLSNNIAPCYMWEEPRVIVSKISVEGVQPFKFN